MESLFQFSTPILKKLNFDINDNFNLTQDKKLSMNIGMNVNVQKNNSNEACVSLEMQIGQCDKNNPFYIQIIEEANFRWKEGLSKEMVDKLLNQNAPSLLLSYIRPIVVQITAASPFPTYNIPFMNFTNK